MLVMTKIVTLFSGSRGNCTLISNNNCNILVDAGLTINHIIDNLSTLNIQPQQINAILVTHEHIDHINALEKWSQLYSTPIYANTDTAQCLATKYSIDNIVDIQQDFVIGDFAVHTIECSHDSQHCNGYRLSSNSDDVAVVTDTGIVTQSLLDGLHGCRSVVIESNHDLDMLKRGSYPYNLKRRILSSRGHLSNCQCGTVIDSLIAGGTRNIILAHLSEHNNTHELAFASAMQHLNNNKVVEGKDVRLYVASQYTRGDIVE